MKHEKFSISKRLKSFTYAFNGLRILLKEEHNARIHLVLALLAVLLGWLLSLNATEWALLVFAIGFVLTTEILNSSIENIADFISPEKHEMIRRIKDLSAAAVLVSAITALIIGLLLFLPKLLDFVH